MENPPNKWRFLAGTIIYKWAIYAMAMLNNQRVAIQPTKNVTINKKHQKTRFHQRKRWDLIGD